MHGTYNIYFVFLSYVIAFIASYIALDLSLHLRKPSTRTFYVVWLINGAVVLGIGLWSLNFVGMLAYIMPIRMAYSLPWVGCSIVMAILVAALVFFLYSKKNPQVKDYLITGTALGITIPIITYMTIASLEDIKIQYRIGLFILSFITSVIGATLSLWCVVKSDKGSFSTRLRLKLESALIMGGTLTAIHYIGMYAAVFTPQEMEGEHLYLDPISLGISISAIVISIMLVSLVFSTDKYFLSQSLRNKSEFMETILNNMSGGVIACDAQGKITLFNRSAADLFGSLIKLKESLHELGTRFSFYKDLTNERLNLDETPLCRALNGEKISHLELNTYDSKGQKRSLLVEGQELRGGDDEKLGAVIVFNDISQAKLAEEDLKYRATHDVLTGLSNRMLLLDRLNQAIVRANRSGFNITIIFIDLDLFKIINDALGHSIGDKLLQTVAARIRALIRNSDTLARIGGDEFVIVIPDQINIDKIPLLLERILENISRPYQIEDHELNVTCSMGFSVFPDNGTDAETLLKNADAAMYQAKEKGRNTFQFYEGEMNTKVKKRLEIENGLRRALVNNEFILEYQPKLDIQTGKLVGFEALIRWKHPTQGLIPPNEFIPIAEDTGLIIPIGKWVLKTACEQNKAWQDAGIEPFCISVNLSARQSKERDLFATVKDILNETGLKPKYLELELTESLAMSNPKEFIELISQFREIGVKTSIDDFGTGYSSLNYLRQFPVNTLKIDQSFIAAIGSKKGDVSIVKAIVSLGHSLNMKIIAEGVETKEQLLLLQEHDCDEVQGYYVSPSLPVQEVPQFLKTNVKYKRRGRKKTEIKKDEV